MELRPSLTLLAEQTRSGVAFVTAYGLTWLTCGAFWHRASARRLSRRGRRTAASSRSPGRFRLPAPLASAF